MSRHVYAVALSSLLLAAASAHADQADGARSAVRADNVLYVELLGSGGLASLNYERIFMRNLALRAGASFCAAAGGSNQTLSYALGFPLLAEWIGVGNERHHLELGAGLVPIFRRQGESTAGFVSIVDVPPILGALVVGYRYQRSEGGFVFRVGFTPLFGGQGYGFRPWAGVSLGAAL